MATHQPIYSMDHRYRGHALIIVNENFNKSLWRKGAKQDILNMTALFKALDFHVSSYMDLSAEEMETVIKKASESEFNKESDCFVLVLSSHGVEVKSNEENNTLLWRHAVTGSDDENVYVDKILDMFDDKKIDDSQLKGKPKLFFIQACRYGHLTYRYGKMEAFDIGTDVTVQLSKEDMMNVQPSDAQQYDNFLFEVQKQPECDVHKEWRKETDNWLPGKRSLVDIHGTLPMGEGEHSQVDADRDPIPPESAYDLVPMTCPDDCSVIYPAMAGKYAFRDRYAGSFMLHYMCIPTVRKSLFEGKAFLHYCTKVTHHMSQADMEHQLSGCMIHKLRKNLKFVPKKPDSVMAKMRMN